MRSYSELVLLPTYSERLDYLALNGKVGDPTFGNERYLNQTFYTSYEWKKVRAEVILRDNGCDLGIEDRPISGKIFVHHMNPISIEDILSHSAKLLNPDWLITVSKDTHDAIHFNKESILKKEYVERFPNDTCPWKLNS